MQKVTITAEVTPDQAIAIAKLLGESPTPAVAPAAPVTSVAQPMPAAPALPAAAPPVAIPVQSAPPVVPPIQTAPVAPPAQGVPTTPTPMPAPAPAPAPAQQMPPTAARKYTQDELALASRPIMEAGRTEELLNFLHSFTYTDASGNVQPVQSIQQLPEESYPAFANGIRAMGGKI